MAKNKMFILTDGTHLLGVDTATEDHFNMLNDILARDSNIVARWVEHQGNGYNDLYICTDGADIADTRMMSVEDAIEENRKSREATDGTWYWALAGQQPNPYAYLLD